MDVNIVSICVHVSAEYQWSIHERARIDKFAFLSNLHFLHIKNEASVEDLLSQSTLTAKNDDFIFSNLISQTHVTWNPCRFVTQWPGGLRTDSSNFLPDILRNIVALNGVYDSLLVNSTSEGKDVVVFEGAEGYT